MATRSKSRRKKPVVLTLPSEEREEKLKPGFVPRRDRGMGLHVGDDRIARAQSVHDYLRRGGCIDQTQHDAAERYRDDYEAAHGAQNGDTGGVSVAGWERTPGVAQINAITRLRRANEVLGNALPLVVAAVVWGDSMSALTLQFGGADGGEGSDGGRAMDRVEVAMKEALVDLERHYFGARGRVEVAA